MCLRFLARAARKLASLTLSENSDGASPRLSRHSRAPGHFFSWGAKSAGLNLHPQSTPLHHVSIHADTLTSWAVHRNCEIRTSLTVFSVCTSPRTPGAFSLRVLQNFLALLTLTDRCLCSRNQVSLRPANPMREGLFRIELDAKKT